MLEKVIKNGSPNGATIKLDPQKDTKRVAAPGDPSAQETLTVTKTTHLKITYLQKDEIQVRES